MKMGDHLVPNSREDNFGQKKGQTDRNKVQTEKDLQYGCMAQLHMMPVISALPFPSLWWGALKALPGEAHIWGWGYCSPCEQTDPSSNLGELEAGRPAILVTVPHSQQQ
mmetsp:Transcript_67032/g.112476  ORF Transcript_67032/g.112476 Transcript_67032/m.112476 type:complete len:109 (+) Transcript_67032:101-427(+)